jgi:hypothetical protein
MALEQNNALEHISAVTETLEKYTETLPISVRTCLGNNIVVVDLGPACGENCFFCEVCGFPFGQDTEPGHQFLTSDDVLYAIRNLLPEYSIRVSGAYTETPSSDCLPSLPSFFYFSDPFNWNVDGRTILDIVDWVYEYRGRAALLGMKHNITTSLPEGSEHLLDPLLQKFDYYAALINASTEPLLAGDVFLVRISLTNTNEERILSILVNLYERGIIDINGRTSSGGAGLILTERRIQKRHLEQSSKVTALYGSHRELLVNLLTAKGAWDFGRDEMECWPEPGWTLADYSRGGRLAPLLFREQASDPFFNLTGAAGSASCGQRGVFVASTGQPFNIVGNGALTQDDPHGLLAYPIAFQHESSIFYRIVEAAHTSQGLIEPYPVQVFDAIGDLVGRFQVLPPPLIYAKLNELHRGNQGSLKQHMSYIHPCARTIKKMCTESQRTALAHVGLFDMSVQSPAQAQTILAHARTILLDFLFNEEWCAGDPSKLRERQTLKRILE